MLMAAAATVVAGSIFMIARMPEGFAPAKSMLAQVGVVVGVAPNPYNTLNAQLSQEKTQLDMEAADLAAQRAALASATTTGGSASPAAIPWYFMVVIGVLAFFAGLSFHLGARRERGEWRGGPEQGKETPTAA